MEILPFDLSKLSRGAELKLEASAHLAPTMSKSVQYMRGGSLVDRSPKVIVSFPEFQTKTLGDYPLDAGGLKSSPL